MPHFIRNHWYVLSLTALAALAAGVCIFFPPVMVAGLAIALASSPALAALGSFAVPAAITAVSVAAAATVYAVGGLVHGVASLINWGIHKCFAPKTTPKEKEPEAAPTTPVVLFSSHSPDDAKKVPPPFRPLRARTMSDALTDVEMHSPCAERQGAPYQLYDLNKRRRVDVDAAPQDTRTIGGYSFFNAPSARRSPLPTLAEDGLDTPKSGASI